MSYIIVIELFNIQPPFGSIQGVDALNKLELYTSSGKKSLTSIPIVKVKHNSEKNSAIKGDQYFKA